MINKPDIIEHIAQVLFEHFKKDQKRNFPKFDVKTFDRSYVYDHEFFEKILEHYEDSLHAALGDNYDNIFSDWMEKLVDELWCTGVERFEEMCAEAHYNEVNKPYGVR